MGSTSWRARGPVITIEVKPEEIELALASNGDSLRRGLMMALITAMAVDMGDIPESLARAVRGQ